MIYRYSYWKTSPRRSPRPRLGGCIPFLTGPRAPPASAHHYHAHHQAPLTVTTWKHSGLNYITRPSKYPESGRPGELQVHKQQLKVKSEQATSERFEKRCTPLSHWSADLEAQGPSVRFETLSLSCAHNFLCSVTRNSSRILPTL